MNDAEQLPASTGRFPTLALVTVVPLALIVGRLARVLASPSDAFASYERSNAWAPSNIHSCVVDSGLSMAGQISSSAVLAVSRSRCLCR